MNARGGGVGEVTCYELHPIQGVRARHIRHVTQTGISSSWMDFLARECRLCTYLQYKAYMLL